MSSNRERENERGRGEGRGVRVINEGGREGEGKGREEWECVCVFVCECVRTEDEAVRFAQPLVRGSAENGRAHHCQVGQRQCPPMSRRRPAEANYCSSARGAAPSMGRYRWSLRSWRPPRCRLLHGFNGIHRASKKESTVASEKMFQEDGQPESPNLLKRISVENARRQYNRQI